MFKGLTSIEREWRYIEWVEFKEDGDDSVLVAGQWVDDEIATALSSVHTSVHVFTTDNKRSVNSSTTQSHYTTTVTIYVSLADTTTTNSSSSTINTTTGLCTTSQLILHVWCSRRNYLHHSVAWQGRRSKSMGNGNFKGVKTL